MLETVVTAGGFSALVLLGIRWLWRKFVVKDMSYLFPLAFYSISIPVMNVLVIPVLAFIGFSGFTMPTDWLGWVREAIQVLIASAITVFASTGVFQPIQEYRRLLLQKGK